MAKDYSKRRLLLQCEGKLYKLLSFEQNYTDGSIYVGFRNFPQIKWVGVDTADGELKLQLADSAQGDGKLSIHGSGDVQFRAHDTPGEPKLIIKGNYLLDRKNSQAGVRHLITIFMDAPEDVSLSSNFGRRDSDFMVNNSASLKPFVMILFAVPRVSGIQNVGVQYSFNIDDLESMPPESGFGLLELRHHSIAWLIYRTKYMNNWPVSSIVSYTDGYWVPMFIGKGINEDSHELSSYWIIRPEYSFEGNNLTIKINSATDELSKSETN